MFLYIPGAENGREYSMLDVSTILHVIAHIIGYAVLGFVAVLVVCVILIVFAATIREA